MKMSKGFTLLELMIAITLGLLITAASIMLFLSVSRGYSAQKASSEIQGNATFGLPHIIRQLRQIPAEGGVLFNQSIAKQANTNFTVNTQSDLLTVRYTITPSQLVAHNNNLVTCEGTSIATGLANQFTQQINADHEIQEAIAAHDEVKKSTRQQALKQVFDSQQVTVTEQYFLTQNGLTCRSALKNAALTGNGTVIIPNVDYFHVQLITKNQNSFKNIDIPNAQPVENIVGLQLGILLRSGNQIQGASYININDDIPVLNEIVKLNTGASAQLLRQVVVQTIAIRN